jgi:alkaline phosphatase D
VSDQFTSRRKVLRGALAAGVAQAAVAGLGSKAFANTANQNVLFTHGVASGDPLANQVILWTRALAEGASASFYVYWSVSERADMLRPVTGGLVLASADNDWCCKVDALGLAPGKTYYYQFVYRDRRSPIGITKTLPVGDVANIKLAFFSCSNHPKGHFNVYREAARRDDLNAVLHLGDYLYEYGPTGYQTAGLAAGRNSLGQTVTQPRIDQLNPKNEIVTLADYRQRFALYRSDPDLQELHRKNAWITVWDDHESTNDSWRNGAENHQPATEGPWETRLQTATRAYDEWMPIRTALDGNRLRIWRAFDFGNLARLVMLDTRLEGRDQYALTQDQFLSYYLTARPDGTFPADVVPGTTTPRRIMSVEQESFIQTQLSTSTQPWQIIGNQTLLHFQSAPNFSDSRVLPTAVRDALVAGVQQLLGGPAGLAQYNQLARAGLPLYDFVADSWAAYPTARTRFLSTLLQAARNPLVLTGDSHNSWAANLRLPTASALVNVGVEIATPSVSSPGFEEALPDIPATALSAVVLESNTAPAPSRVDQLVYAETARRGFVLLDITRERTQAEWVLVNTVFNTTYTATVDRTLTVAAGARRFT